MCNPWSSAIWAMIRQPALPLPVIPETASRNFYGEYLVNAQGEDVVAGIRTPAPINEYSKSGHNKELLTLEKGMPEDLQGAL